MTLISALQAFPEPSNRHLKSLTMIREFSAARKLLAYRFASLNGDCSAQDRPSELKLVSLEPPRNKDSEFVF
jgi:hypothetical protein